MAVIPMIRTDAALTYKWTKKTGPAVYSLSNDAVANPDLTNLLLGTYEFQLETTDAQGAKTQDVVAVYSSATMLPVRLSYFKGSAATGATKLVWATAQEQDNDHFAIERSVDGKFFNTIGVVPAGGNSMIQQTYAYTDQQEFGGAWYYRLKLVNTSGKTTMYSPVVRVENNRTKARLEYFPNPVQDNISVLINDEHKGLLQLRLLGMDGKVMIQKQWMKKEEFITTVMDVKQLVAGIYLLEVTIGDQLREIRKVVKN